MDLTPNLVSRVLPYPNPFSLRRAGRREPWERGWVSSPFFLILTRFIVLSSGTTETVIAKERFKWLTFAPEQCESSWNLVQLM